jgi:hypothetical protein
MPWNVSRHYEVPADAGLVLGSIENGMVQWLDMGPSAPPVNIDVPHVTQAGATMSCTMGNWDHEPTSYAYRWQSDGTNIGTNSPTYAVQPADVGTTFTCLVTATNALGSTPAPLSNAVVAT